MERMPPQTIKQEMEAARDIATLGNNRAHNNTVIMLYTKAKSSVNQITFRNSRNIYTHILKKRTVESLNRKYLPIPYHTDMSLYWYSEPEQESEPTNSNNED